VTIFLDAETTLSLSDYDGLVTCIGSWLNRSDLQDQIPDFIKLAEARFRRVIVMPQMEVQVSFGDAVSTALPADFDSLRGLAIPGFEPMKQITLADYNRLIPELMGTPDRFTIVAGAIKTWPIADDVYSATLTYRANIPPLGPDQETNWLLTKHPDIYLFGSLAQAEFYGWNDDRLTLIKAALDESLDELQMAGNRLRYGSGPLVMRSDVRERC